MRLERQDYVKEKKWSILLWVSKTCSIKFASPSYIFNWSSTQRARGLMWDFCPEQTLVRRYSSMGQQTSEPTGRAQCGKCQDKGMRKHLGMEDVRTI